jgi:aminopeptidase
MPSGTATHPADVVFASNGKSIEIDNTDAEGRLILSDALVYSQTFNPHTVIDMATLTGAIGTHHCRCCWFFLLFLNYLHFNAN